MEAVFKVLGAVLISVVLSLALGQHSKDIAVVLSVAVSCMVLMCALRYLEPVVDFLIYLQRLCDTSDVTFSVLFKAVGIGIVSQIAALICADSGNAATGKAIQILTAAVLLYLSIPVMRALLELLEQMLEGV